MTSPSPPGSTSSDHHTLSQSPRAATINAAIPFSAFFLTSQLLSTRGIFTPGFEELQVCCAVVGSAGGIVCKRALCAPRYSSKGLPEHDATGCHLSGHGQSVTWYFPLNEGLSHSFFLSGGGKASCGAICTALMILRASITGQGSA